jgi:hypothetical protein
MQTEKRSIFLALVLVGLALVACEVPPVPHAFLPDTAFVDAYREDTGITIVHDSGPRDTGLEPDTSFDANVDAPGFDAGPIDGGPLRAITLDGAFGDAFWGTASSQPNSTPTNTGFDGDSLTVLHYGRDDNYLYLGFEGTLVPGDAVVVYVDTQVGAGPILMGGLADTHGVVNSVLSSTLTSAVPDFQPEWGWGTSTMPRSITTSDATIGWRRLATNPGTFTTVTANELSACSTSGCETAILLAQLGVPTGGPIELIVRLGRPTIGFSNQTFPASEASSPETVTDTYLVPAAL